MNARCRKEKTKFSTVKGKRCINDPVILKLVDGRWREMSVDGM